MDSCADARGASLVPHVRERNRGIPMKRLSGWLPHLFLLLTFTICDAAEKPAKIHPAVTAVPAISAPPAIAVADAPSATATTPSAPSWRERYTLGPGDVLSFALYGRPEFLRNDVTVQPDGNISYLQAAAIHAEGLTIAELRLKFEEELGKYYRRPRVIITPSEMRSKKYFVVGKVVNNGAFSMERPITLMEALARAQGFETGLVEEKTVEMADLAKSFLVRKGRRVPVDFEKLFLHGDMTQNVEMEPGDYLHIASAGSNDVNVLGEVVRPGLQGYIGNLTVVGVIAMRGGYSKNAYRNRVLVVRGALGHPQLFVVNTNDVLKGHAKDFPLQPKDIVFVSQRPWLAAEEILDLAISAFFQGAASSYGARLFTK